MALRYIVENDLNRIVVDAAAPVARASSPAATPASRSWRRWPRSGSTSASWPRSACAILKLGALSPFDGQAVRRLAAGTSTVLVVEDKRAQRRDAGARRALRRRRPAPAWSASGTPKASRSSPSPARSPPRAWSSRCDGVLTTVLPPERLAPARTAAKLALHAQPAGRAHTVLLLGLSAQHRHAGARGLPGRRRHRLSRHGQLHGRRLAGDDHGHHPDGRRGQRSGSASRPFVDDPHLFQNLGDGTFFHSGQLAVQAAVAAGVDITFKLLYNAAVAMTGGQDATGLLPVPAVAAKLLREGVKEVVITTDDPGKYRGVALPEGASRPAPRPTSSRRRSSCATVAGRHRADPRPAVRGREAPRPQAGPAAPAGVQRS